MAKIVIFSSGLYQETILLLYRNILEAKSVIKAKVLLKNLKISEILKNNRKQQCDRCGSRTCKVMDMQKRTKTSAAAKEKKRFAVAKFALKQSSFQKY